MLGTGLLLGTAVGFVLGYTSKHFLPGWITAVRTPVPEPEVYLWEDATVAKATRNYMSDYIITLPTSYGRILQYRGDIIFRDMADGQTVDYDFNKRLEALVKKHEWDQELVKKLTD